MTSGKDLGVLQQLAERSLEGYSMTASVLQESGIDPATVRNLELEGLVEVINEGGEPAVVLTDAGLSVLEPRNSA